MTRSAQSPWKRRNPRKARGKAPKHFSTKEKAIAKASARRAGRRYPNLVDNMRVAAAKKSGAKRRSTSSTTAKKFNTTRGTRRAAEGKMHRVTATRREKDPRGGLTAAGRKKISETEGAHLRPGVTKRIADMTPAEMRRKGSWAVRFYGRKPLPPLVDQQGRPTRFALSAHAWGEPVPRTATAARKIATKGKRLLARYQKIQEGRKTGRR
jgi:hypothetical protein